MIEERECCGTFKGTPHRKTCAKFRGYTQADIEAAIEATKERAAKVCEELGMATNGIYERNHECAKAIRSMK